MTTAAGALECDETPTGVRERRCIVTGEVLPEACSSVSSWIPKADRARRRGETAGPRHVGQRPTRHP